MGYLRMVTACLVALLMATPAVAMGILPDVALEDEGFASYEEAADHYAAAVYAAPDDLEARWAYAACLMQLKQFEKALAQYNAILHYAPEDMDARLARAKVLAAMGELEQALAAYDEIYLKEELYLQALVGKAFAYWKAGERDRAFFWLAEVLHFDPKHPEALELRSMMLGGGAGADFEGSETLYAAEAAFNAGDFDDARKNYEQVVAEEPGNSRAWKQLAKLYQWDQDWPQAASALAQYLELQPEDTDMRLRYARVLYYGREYERSREQFELLLADPSLSEGQYQQAVGSYAGVLNATGKTEEALKRYEEAIEKNPEDHEMRLAYATTLAGNGRLDEALMQADIVLQQDPGNAQAYLARARAFSWNGNLKAAAAEYDRIGRNSDSYDMAQLGKAYVLMWQGKRDESRSVLAPVLEENPENGDAVELDRLLNEIPKPRLEYRHRMSHDSDDNDYSGHETTLFVPFNSDGGEVQIRYDNFKLDHTGRDEITNGSNTRLTVIWPITSKLRWRGSMHYTDLGNDPEDDVDNWGWGTDVLYRHSEDWNYGVSYVDYTLYDTTQLARNDIQLREWTVFTDFRVFDDRTRLYLQSGLGDFSDDNSRTTLSARLNRYKLFPKKGRLDYGVAYRWLSYDQQTPSGYWDPDDYDYLELYADWQDRSDRRLKFDAGAGYGIDKDGGNPWRGVFRWYAGLRYKVKEGYVLRSGYSTSDASTTATSGPGYEYETWYVGFDLQF